MKIGQINNQNFSAKTDQRFISGAEAFFIKRNMIFQYNALKKSADKIEYYGKENSEIVYKSIPQKPGFEHLLCFKNEEINQKRAIVLIKTKIFTDVVKFFNNITESMIKDWENILEKTS